MQRVFASERPVPRDGENFILAEVAAEAKVQHRDAGAGNREHADEERPAGHRHLATQAAEFADVLLVVRAFDDLAGAEEHQGLEEGVRQQVEEGRDPGAHAHTEHHVAELADGAVCQHLLDVGLHDGDQGSQCQGYAADDRDEELRFGRQQHEDAGRQIDAGGHHCCRVDQRRDGRRAFHRIRQPHVQRELGAFANRAAEEQHAHPGRQVQAQERLGEQRAADFPLLMEGLGRALERKIVQEQINQADPDNKGEITHAVSDKRLYRGVAGALLVEIEADQQVRAQAHQFPRDEEQQQAVGDDQQQHAEAEQAEVGEEAVELADLVDFVTVAGHVADAEHENPGRDETDHEEHDQRQAVEVDAEGERDAAQVRPQVGSGSRRQAGRGIHSLPLHQRRRTEAAARRDCRDRHPARQRLAQPAAE